MHNTQKRLKVTLYGRNKTFVELYINYALEFELLKSMDSFSLYTHLEIDEGNWMIARTGLEVKKNQFSKKLNSTKNLQITHWTIRKMLKILKG